MMTLVDLQKRVCWVLKKIMKDGLSKESLSNSLECDAAALDDFLNLRAIIETENIMRLRERYGVNPVWIYTGKESPFYPDSEGSMAPGDDTGGADRIPAFSGEFEFTTDMKTEYLEKLKRIIESKSRYTHFLVMFINIFHDAMKNEVKRDKKIQEQKELKEKIRVLEKRLEKDGS